MHKHEHQIVRCHLVWCREHRDEQVIPLQFRADGSHAQRLQPRCVGDADGTEPFELAQEKAQGVTVGIDPLLPLPASEGGRVPDRIVPYQSRWPIDVGSVVYTDHAHYTLFLLDTQDDSVLAAPRTAEAFQLIVQGLGDSPGILAQRPVDELENRPGGVERDSPGRARLESSEHSGREPDGVCVAHASASSWRWRSSSAARRSSSV